MWHQGCFNCRFANGIKLHTFPNTCSNNQNWGILLCDTSYVKPENEIYLVDNTCCKMLLQEKCIKMRRYFLLLTRRMIGLATGSPITFHPLVECRLPILDFRLVGLMILLEDPGFRYVMIWRSTLSIEIAC